ncbi:zinc finger MYND domain-containing protein 10-like [Anneissia japonica]|uniref:zinc finger MYND domain-containing protein 10-like n=1 Tax=Anneissia japonica TaxID=1529436 RepID=UPI00142596C5|nr:zinc finger MYND domain-containing protein 10-like [Anneissia japonica]
MATIRWMLRNEVSQDMEGSHIILPVEAEAYVESLQKYKIKDIGNAKWMKQHDQLEKLNMQAVLNASANQDEFIKEMLISHDKICILVHELLALELWKQKVWSIISNINFEPSSTFPLYMTLYHEATISNLIETTFFYKETCEGAGDCILDLVDYCYRKITALLARQEDGEEFFQEENKSLNKDSTGNLQELIDQEQKISFEVGIKAVSILRYITDHMSSLPLSVTTRLLNIHDIPCLLVSLVESPPWSTFKNGKQMKYVDGKWLEIPAEQRLQLTKMDGQVWIAVFNLMMSETCQQKYEFNSHNKATILKLRGHLSEVTIDQIPNLGDLQRYLENLAVIEPPPARTGLLLEQVPEIRDMLLSQNEGKWGAIAKHQVKTVFNPSTQELQEQAKRFAETYNFDMLGDLIAEPPKCVVCGELATKRCSRCQNEWYCRRECQVKHWSKHKQACNLIHEEQIKKENKS